MDDSVGPPSNRASARLSIVVVSVGLAWLALHALGLADPDGSYTMILAALVALVATVVGLRRWRPQPAWPWLAVAAALGLFLTADVLRLAYGTLGNLGPTRSLVPDLLALPGYVLLAVGVAGLAGVGRGHRDDTDAILDGVICALAVLTLAWVYIVTPSLGRMGVSLTVEVTLAAYPVASVFVFAMGARLVYDRGRDAPASLWLFMGAIFFLLVGDVVFALVDASLWTVPDHLADIPYSLAFLAYSTAVLHPSIRRISQHRASDELAPSRGRLLTVALALFIPTLVLLTGLRSDASTTDRVALGVIVVLLVGVAVWRMWRALRQHASSGARLAQQATHDSLTGLPNRRFLTERIGRAMGQEREISGSLTLLHIDIDRFTLVNDTMGHEVGDELLRAVGERLSERVRAGDLVGRIGGDEFAVVATGLEDEACAIDFGERARLMFKEPLIVDGDEISVDASIGIAFQRAGQGEVGSLMRDADTALNHAKGGGDAVACFDASMRERVAERLHLERELRHALARQQLSLHYQPKVRLDDERVVGLEALLRWEHPELGMIPPDKFIAIAEDTGMIVDIGAWVIDEACAELARIHAALPPRTSITMSVNVSARQLRSESFVDTLTRALVTHRVPPEALCIELTESAVVENLDAVADELQAVRGFGTRISMDDFGTGYSSLAYLSKLPVDEIKIDRSFIVALAHDASAASLIQAVVFIASSLGITTVAEGVETLEQARQVEALGCTEVQGFLYSRPVPADQLVTRLAELGLAPRGLLRSVPALPPSTRASIA